MWHRCFRSTLAWLLAMVGAGHMVAGLAAAAPKTWAEIFHPPKKNDTNAGPPHKPFNAEGQPLLIPARAEMRCRYAFTNRKRLHKLYRVFLGHTMVPYPGWCDVMRAALRNRCWAGEKMSRERIQWLRCDTDARDMLWQRGAVATFKLELPPDSKPECVADAVKASVPGSQVDWMGELGCYEAYGYEIEY